MTELSAPSNIIEGGLDNAFLSVPQDKITAPGGYNNEEPYRACDGNTSTKWCYRQDGIYLQVDLGEGNSWTIDKFTLVNAGSENPNYITRDFRILTSDNGTDWTEQVKVTGNTENVVEIVLDEPVTARYYKLIPDYAGQTGSDANCPRIYEFQAWGRSSGRWLPLRRMSASAFIKTRTTPLRSSWMALIPM